MALRLGDAAPDFTQDSTIGSLHFYEWAGDSWVVLFSHPADNTATVRSVFVIDPNKKIRLTLTYPASTGRDFDELLRVIDSLQLTDEYKVAPPVDWEPDDEVVILPSVQDPGELQQRFPQGYRELRPYLRMTKVPQA